MRICDSYGSRCMQELCNVGAGKSVKFEHVFHQDYSPNDVFMVNQVASGYRPEEAKYNGKVGVSNLRTGKLSYVEGSRKVEILDAEVHICRDC